MRWSVLLRARAFACAIILALIGAACGAAVTPEAPPDTGSSGSESLPADTAVPIPTESSLPAASPTTDTAASSAEVSPTEIPTAVPSATEPGRSSANAGPATANFSLQDANGTTPGDVLNEIGYGGMGGGYTCSKGGSEYHGLEFDDYTMDVADWLGLITATVCGWQDGEQVEISLQDPNGSEIYTETQSAGPGPGADAYGVLFEHGLTLDNPVGTYTLTFAGDSGTIQKTVQVSWSQGPKMYYVQSLGGYYLYGFAPGEHIRFFCFCNVVQHQFAYDLSGWSDYNADQNGNLIVYVGEHGDAMYRAIGDVSGEVGDGLNPHGPNDPGAYRALPTP